MKKLPNEYQLAIAVGAILAAILITATITNATFIHMAPATEVGRYDRR
jgi:hypothetical protein